MVHLQSEFSNTVDICGTLSVTVMKATSLVRIRGNSKKKRCDPFCILRVGQNRSSGMQLACAEQRTSVQSDTLSPVWNETYEFSPKKWSMTHILLIDIMDDKAEMGQVEIRVRP